MQSSSFKYLTIICKDFKALPSIQFLLASKYWRETLSPIPRHSTQNDFVSMLQLLMLRILRVMGLEIRVFRIGMVLAEETDGILISVIYSMQKAYLLSIQKNMHSTSSETGISSRQITLMFQQETLLNTRQRNYSQVIGSFLITKWKSSTMKVERLSMRVGRQMDLALRQSSLYLLASQNSAMLQYFLNPAIDCKVQWEESAGCQGNLILAIVLYFSLSLLKSCLIFSWLQIILFFTLFCYEIWLDSCWGWRVQQQLTLIVSSSFFSKSFRICWRVDVNPVCLSISLSMFLKLSESVLSLMLLWKNCSGSSPNSLAKMLSSIILAATFLSKGVDYLFLRTSSGHFFLKSMKVLIFFSSDSSGFQYFFFLSQCLKLSPPSMNSLREPRSGLRFLQMQAFCKDWATVNSLGKEFVREDDFQDKLLLKSKSLRVILGRLGDSSIIGDQYFITHRTCKVTLSTSGIYNN